MNTLEIENIEEIDISDILPDKVIHIYADGDKAALCGAPEDPSHACLRYKVMKNDKECPECGVPYCSYCRLLADQWFK